METFKHVLAFPMFATAVWLVWVFGQQVGNDGVALLLFGLLLAGIAGWAWGRWAPSSSRVRRVSRSMAGIGLVGAVALCVIGSSFDRSAAASVNSADRADGDGWQAYSTAAVESLVAEGHPVFIDFTAAWCLTCQVNKRTTLRSETVTAAFRERGVVLMRADWTNQDPEITRALESLGRSGVPVYVLYPGDGCDPVLLPEILTRDLVLQALDDIPTAADVESADSRSLTSL
jgi:thiol:disulfide interchange protein DsbD